MILNISKKDYEISKKDVLFAKIKYEIIGVLISVLSVLIIYISHLISDSRWFIVSTIILSLLLAVLGLAFFTKFSNISIMHSTLRLKKSIINQNIEFNDIKEKLQKNDEIKIHGKLYKIEVIESDDFDLQIKNKQGTLCFFQKANSMEKSLPLSTNNVYYSIKYLEKPLLINDVHYCNIVNQAIVKWYYRTEK